MDRDFALTAEEMGDEFCNTSTRRFHEEMDALALEYITENLVDYVMGGTAMPLFVKYANVLSKERLEKLREAWGLLFAGPV